jgi:hypothetical protein
MTASTPSKGASALHKASNAVRPHPKLGPLAVSADASQRRFMRISRHSTENAEHSRRSWRTRRLVGGMGPGQYCRVAIARRGCAGKCAANQRHTALEGRILVRPCTVAQTVASELAPANCTHPPTPVARCHARCAFYPAFHLHDHNPDSRPSREAPPVVRRRELRWRGGTPSGGCFRMAAGDPDECGVPEVRA